ncbi:hypothetical protein HDE_07582 [Halotydeus destructor]|nr:hypothetical protein HDE_07582 [Halotydeus destructor]
MKLQVILIFSVIWTLVVGQNPFTILKISKVARTALNKLHNQMGSRHGRDVSHQLAELDGVVIGGQAHTQVVRRRRQTGKKILKFAKCRTAYYLFRPKECGKTDLF